MTRRTRIKFCGMTRTEDIEAAAALGVDAVGLIFVAQSSRHLTVAAGKALRASAPPFTTVVALVKDASPVQVRQVVEIVRPALLQFHGSEPEADCRLAGLAYLKALPMGEGATDAERAAAGYPSASGFVLDGHAPGMSGGSGERFDWSRWPRQVRQPLLLAGGLTPDNVFDAVCQLRPFAVDVSSGIECAPGVKCPQRMARFVDEVRRADGVLQADADPSFTP